MLPTVSPSAQLGRPVVPCSRSGQPVLCSRPRRQQCGPAQSQSSSCSSVPRGSTACRVAAFDGVATLEQELFASTVSLPPQQTFADKYTMGDMLGKGTHAQVHVAQCNTTGQQFAVKVLLKKKVHKDRTVQVLMEVEHALKLQSSKYAVRVHDVIEEGNYIYMVQEVCAGGDLSDLLQMNQGGLCEAEVAELMAGVLGFIADAHAQDICFGDVKPANFVLRKLYPSIQHLLDPSQPKGTPQVVAVDFGCCVSDRHQGCLPDNRVTGTPMYMAPEVLAGCHSKEVDVWAAGIMLYQLLSDRFPFWNLGMEQLGSLGPSDIREGILHGVPLFAQEPWFTCVHPSAQELVCRMLERDVSKRITAAEALAHPWFAHARSSGSC